MASNLIAIANLIEVASNLIEMACNLRAMASNVRESDGLFSLCVGLTFVLCLGLNFLTLCKEWNLVLGLQLPCRCGWHCP